MLLVYSITNILLGVLTVSLAVLIFAIAYRKLLAYLGKGSPNKQDFAVLYSLDIQPCQGSVEFFYELKSPKTVRIELLNMKMEVVQVVNEKTGSIGGNIIPFDTKQQPNGDYFYQLVTENQKTTKKMRIKNP